MDDPPDRVIDDALASMSARDIPPQLRDITERHMAAVARLVSTMRAAGIAEDAVRQSVREIVASYEAELMQAMLRLSAKEA